MKKTIAVILAAGRGTRMKSDTPKVLHKILGKSIIKYVIDAVKGAGISDVVVVAGHGSHLLKEELPQASFAIQKKLLGSGDAVRSAGKFVNKDSGDVLVVCGDTPLLKSKTLKSLISKHHSSGASATILTAKLKDPSGYGRISRDQSGRILAIVEQEKAGIFDEVINEINVGTYCFKAKDLFEALGKIGQNNKKKEFFLTDTIAVMKSGGKIIESVITDDENEAFGVNARKDLALSTAIMKSRIAEELMDGGVTIEDISSTLIFPGVKIGRDTIVHSNTVIESDVEIGRNCHIGPFARIRPKVKIGDGVEVGNFVELNRTTVDNGTKIKHHAYLGDATVGRNVNIGAGAITANYDGKSKNPTVIEDGAFIGVGAVLIAPIKVGTGATVGAGSVVPKNHDVPKLATVMGVPARIFSRVLDKFRVPPRVKRSRKK